MLLAMSAHFLAVFFFKYIQILIPKEPEKYKLQYTWHIALDTSCSEDKYILKISFGS